MKAVLLGLNVASKSQKQEIFFKYKVEQLYWRKVATFFESGNMDGVD